MTSAIQARSSPLFTTLGVIALVAALAPVARAHTPPSDPQVVTVPVSAASDTALRLEPEDAGFNFVLDEHLLVDPTRDHDYNGGGEVTVSGYRAVHNWLSVDPVLGFIDRSALLDAPSVKQLTPSHAFAAGLLVFTPANLQQSAVVPGDRPYASLFFVSSGRRYVSPDAQVAYNSSLTVGILGLSAAESVQRALHELTGSARPRGWSHQISAGGEPTARYGLARQELLGRGSAAGWGDYDLKWTVAGSLGTVTEGSLALSARWGRIASPWWAFTPEQNTYIQDTHPSPPALVPGAPAELFALVGVRCKLRPYNALLEGQFRHNDLSYSADGVNELLGEAWAGLEWRTSSGVELRYLTRWESPELRSGVGSRSIVWGSIEISKSLE